MPYGMKGGDTPENEKWMSNCVKKVKGKKGKDGKIIDEGSAIAICKTTFEKSHGKSEIAEFILNETLLKNQ